MLKLRTLGVCAAAAALFALPTAASAHESHGGGWHGHSGYHGHGWGHGHGYGYRPAFAPFVPFPIPVPVPIGYGPRPAYVAAPYPAPVYAAPVYGPPVYVPAPVISVRTPHVAVSIGGFFPY